MKEEKNKVGRPKLADEQTLKKAKRIIALCVTSIVIIIILAASFLVQIIETKNLQGIAKKDWYFYYQNGRHTQFCGRSGRTIGTSGCGVTAMAMVLRNLKHDSKFTPEYTMKEAYKAGYCGKGISGTSYKYVKYSAEKHGLKYIKLSNNKEGAEKAKKVLESGGVVVASVNSKSPFTAGYHFIVLYDITKDGKVRVANPNKNRQNNNTYSLVGDFINKGWINSGWHGVISEEKTATTTTTKKVTTTKSSSDESNGINESLKSENSKNSNLCYISKIWSNSSSNLLKYKIECTGNAKVANIAYKVDGENYINRHGSWGAETNLEGIIAFRQERMGKKISLKVYYSKDKYDIKSVKLGSGKMYKFDENGSIN